MSWRSSAAALALGFALGVLSRLLRRVEVVGDSMLPTLRPGDRLLVVAGLPPRPADLVALADPRHPARLLIKRVAEVRDDLVVVVGDNPDASTDSRSFGGVRGSAVIGRAVYRYAPEQRRGKLQGGNRPRRFQDFKPVGEVQKRRSD